MSRPICVECRVEYSCEKNEVLINDPVIGYFHATYWYADRWECPGCKHQVIVGRGKSMFLDQTTGTVGSLHAACADSFEFNHNLPAERLEVKNE
jgi:hypothetical protein